MSELTPVLEQSFYDSNGLPLSGGLLYSYVAGTSTPLATYTDETGLTPNTNPVVLNAAGRAPVWMGDNSYKFTLTDSIGNLQFTVDNVQSIASQIAAITSDFESVSISYTQLQTAGLSNAIVLFTLPANCILKNLIIKHSTAFSGTSITDVYTQIGPTGNYSEFIEHFDTYQAVGDQIYDNVVMGYVGSFANPTIIYLNAVSVGANLSALSAGSLTVWYEYENFTTG